MRVRTAALYVAAVLVPVLFLRGLKDLQWHQSASPLTMSFGNPHVRRFNPRAALQFSKRWRRSADVTAATTTANVTDGPIRIRSRLKPPTTGSPPAASGKPQSWLLPENTALVFNEAGREVFGQLEPLGTTIHFTFGSAVMMDFVKNWLHFVGRAQLTPYLVGAADAGLFSFCTDAHVASVAISPELDVWSYQRKPKRQEEVYEIKSEWKYMRHHDSDFLEMGLVKVAFLWELLSARFSVLISDLDVVWLNGHWQRWMTWSHAAAQPVPEVNPNPNPKPNPTPTPHPKQAAEHEATAKRREALQAEAEAEAEAEAAERARLLAWRRRETAPLTAQLHAHERRARV